MRIADPRQEITLVIDDADPRPEIRGIAVHRHTRAKLTNIAHRMMAVGHVETTWAVQIVPLGLVFAVAVKYLHAVVLAVGDIDPAVDVGADIMGDIELAGIGAGLAPG